jgi:hypothetical protein
MAEGRGWPRDGISDRLESLADRIDAELADCCRVERATVGEGLIRLVQVTPHRSGASPAGWMDMVDALQVSVGEGGCRWELARTDADVRFIESIVMSAVEGRVAEVFGPHRSTVAVTLAGGDRVEQTAFSRVRGSLPSPWWRRRGRRVQYLAYRA